ncbi:hypothetical protein ACFX1S_044538 [Malus domestica]
MVSILSAYSHSGLVIQGQILFEKIMSVYNIILDIEHYACMVDLFKRLDLLTRQMIFIAKMPYKPASAMWATPIKACRFHGNVETRE